MEFHTTGMSNFPTMKSRKLLGILMRKPLNYHIIRTHGSHRILSSEKYPQLLYSFHDSVELSGLQVQNILLGEVV
jgi:predicted RNA binding protein YcfA (HicA-like mRNA interferase family)